jgi:hypothetical protein
MFVSFWLDRCKGYNIFLLIFIVCCECDIFQRSVCDKSYDRDDEFSQRWLCRRFDGVFLALTVFMVDSALVSTDRTVDT